MVAQLILAKKNCDLPKIPMILLILDVIIFESSENVNYLLYASALPPTEELSI